MDILKQKARAVLLLFLIVASLGILLTTPSYIAYPNLFNFDQKKSDQFSAYKKEMREIQENVLNKDVALITRLVPADQEACVIATLGPTLLMMADRRPALYLLDLLPPHSFQKEDFEPFYLFTTQRTERLFEDLNKKRPEYIFIEERFMFGQFAQFAMMHHPDFYRLMEYFNQRYTPLAKGGCLIVLRRKE